jgi:chromosome segregation ATPase
MNDLGNFNDGSDYSAMSTTLHPPDETDLPAERITPRRARIDGPHPVFAEPPLVVDDSPVEEVALDQLPIDQLPIEEPSAELIAAVAGLTVEAREEQLKLQAAQLGDHLRERLRAVDRREAQLNARMAQLEADLRASRVWLREREHEFEERETHLRQQIADLQGRGESAEDEVRDLDAVRTELTEREHQLTLKENELRERRFETERQAAALRHSQQLWEQERTRQETELSRERERLAADAKAQAAERDQQLAEREAALAERTEQLDRTAAELAADRQAWEERRRIQSAALDQRIKATEHELAERRDRQDARDQWLQEQRQTLDQLRGEVSAMHRQGLEMRLLAEQLWSQASGRLSPLESTHAIANLRTKLAEHYRLEEATLAEKKQELVAVGQRVTEQHRELSQLREGLKGWLATRQDEIEEQAAALAQREAALDRQHEALIAERRAWKAQSSQRAA